MGIVRHHARMGHDFFFFLGEFVCLPPLDVVQIHPVDIQTGLLGQESVDGFLVHLHQFRFDERSLCPIIGADLTHFLAHAHIRGLACILIRFHHGIAVESEIFLGQVAVECQA